jgi:hypothetical protein
MKLSVLVFCVGMPCGRTDEHTASTFWSEDWSSMMHHNVGIYRQVHTALQPRTASKSPSSWKNSSGKGMLQFQVEIFFKRVYDILYARCFTLWVHFLTCFTFFAISELNERNFIGFTLSIPLLDVDRKLSDISTLLFFTAQIRHEWNGKPSSSNNGHPFVMTCSSNL